MPIYIEWGNPEKTILVERVEGAWTLMDVYAMLEECENMVASVTHTVNIIADLSNAHFPSGNLLSVVGRTQRSKPHNTGSLIVVKANRYMKTVADIATKMWPQVTENFYYVENLEAAFAILSESVPQH